jgi:predicted nucleic acid-binding protein
MYMLDTNMCIYIIKKKTDNVAKSLNMTLVTNNVNEFIRIKDLKTENWL